MSLPESITLQTLILNQALGISNAENLPRPKKSLAAGYNRTKISFLINLKAHTQFNSTATSLKNPDPLSHLDRFSNQPEISPRQAQFDDEKYQSYLSAKKLYQKTTCKSSLRVRGCCTRLRSTRSKWVGSWGLSMEASRGRCKSHRREIQNRKAPARHIAGSRLRSAALKGCTAW